MELNHSSIGNMCCWSDDPTSKEGHLQSLLKLHLQIDFTLTAVENSIMVELTTDSGKEFINCADSLLDFSSRKYLKVDLAVKFSLPDYFYSSLHTIHNTQAYTKIVTS